MNGVFYEMWESGGISAPLTDDLNVEKKYFNKIIISKSDLPDGDKCCYTLDIKDSLFHNEPLKAHLSEEIARILTEFFAKYGITRSSTVLVAALGNDKITADSLGCEVTDRLTVTAHLSDGGIRSKFGNLMGIKCGVSGTTGIASYDVLSSVALKKRPDIIIAVDTLACRSVARLGATIQISDNGIEPGGGVGNAKRKLNEASLPSPVIAIGVPLVIYAKRILAEYVGDGRAYLDKAVSELVVTSKEVDFLVSDYAEVIAEGINRAVHRGQIA